MKFGVNTYIWGSTFGPADFHLLPRIVASGFDGIEVPILNPAAFEVDAVGRELDRLGLARTAVANVPGGSPRRLAVSCDSVAAVGELVAEQVGERLVCELGLLQTDDVRLPLVQPRQEPRDALLDRVDVPGRDPHPRSKPRKPLRLQTVVCRSNR